MNTLLYFYLYSFLGWIAECLYCGLPAKKFINRGFLEGPYCPIYGCGAMIVLALLQPFEYYPLLLFLAGIIVTSTLEYMTSYGMEKLFHTKWWDYSNNACNLHGRICLKNSLLFGCMVLFVYYGLHPLVVDFVAQFSNQTSAIATVVISLCFVIDASITCFVLLKKNIYFHKVEVSIARLYEELKQSSYTTFAQSINDKLKAILTIKSLDEHYVEAMGHVQAHVESFLRTGKHIHARLSRAFPNRIEEVSRKNAQRLFELIRQYREGNK